MVKNQEGVKEQFEFRVVQLKLGIRRFSELEGVARQTVLSTLVWRVSLIGENLANVSSRGRKAFICMRELAGEKDFRGGPKQEVSEARDRN